MGEHCGRCELITAAHKMIATVKSINSEQKYDVVRQFTDGEISFKELGELLGLSEEAMTKFLPKQHLGRKLDE